jgi:hypothetical protein
VLKDSKIVRIYKNGDKTDCNNYRDISICLLRTKFFQHPALSINSIRRGNHLGSSMWISTQQVNYCSNNLQILEIKSECNEGVRQPYIYFKRACGSIRREVLFNSLIESAILMKLANTLGYATTKVIGSRNSFVIAFVRSSIH